MSKGLTRGGFAAIFLWFCRLDKRFEKSAQFSANRHVYYVDIKTEEEIDGELVGWVSEAYSLSGNTR